MRFSENSLNKISSVNHIIHNFQKNNQNLKNKIILFIIHIQRISKRENPYFSFINDNYYQIFIDDLKGKETSKDYLQRIMEILYFPNDVGKNEGDYKSLLSIIQDKNKNYLITNDNYNKMLLLIYRIKANIPVILLGETGCGKTALIFKLDQILNNGKNSIKIINMKPGTTDLILYEKIRKIENDINKEGEKKDEILLFFDNMENCISLSILTEIFIKKTYNKKKINNKIRLIGAFAPYMKRKEVEELGLSVLDYNDNEMDYSIQTLPQSLLYFAFNFWQINYNDEKKYIKGIIEKLFLKEERDLHESTSEAISECHKFFRELFGPSVVSLREIIRFKKCFDFFQKYFIIKNGCEKLYNNEQNNKIRSIICSLYLCYYMRLENEKRRIHFQNKLRPILLKLINEKKYIDKGENLFDEIQNIDLKNEINNRYEEIIRRFYDFVKIEQNYLLDQIELDKGISNNSLLKENVFSLFVSIITKIPIIFIGKPGSGKSLTVQIINSA